MPAWRRGRRRARRATGRPARQRACGAGTGRAWPRTLTRRSNHVPLIWRHGACAMSDCRRDRPAALALVLVRLDRVALLERQRDVVEAVEQPVLDLPVDLEAGASARPADLLGGEVDLRVA